MNIETYGTGKRLEIAARLCRELPFSHLVLLPVPTTKDKACISKTDIPLSDTLSNLRAGSVLVGYALPAEYKNTAEIRGAEVLDLCYDEDFQAENADLSALGALAYILSSEKRAPCDIRFGVVGYGRIGSRITRMLLFLGASVKVYTSKPSVSYALGECGLATVCVSGSGCRDYDFSEIQILINTAPKDMSEAFSGGKLPDGMRLIELASGDNFDGVEGVERLPSIPEKMYPESAGGAYARAVKRLILNGRKS